MNSIGRISVEIEKENGLPVEDQMIRLLSFRRMRMSSFWRWE